METEYVTCPKCRHEKHVQDVSCDFCDLTRELEELREERRPRPVSESPPLGVPVLCYVPGACSVHLTIPYLRIPGDRWLRLAREEDGWYRCHGTQLGPDSVTHWLPMPPNPE